MKTGDKVFITGTWGTSAGRIGELRTLHELPDVPGIDLTEIKAILGEKQVDQIALIEYWDGHRHSLFVAVHCQTPMPAWIDLQGQQLEITLAPAWYELPNGRPN